MELTPYLEGLRRDLAAAAAPGGPEVGQAADLLAGALDAAVRLSLLEVLSDAAAEITTKLDGPTVEVRLHGRTADLVVNDREPGPAPAGPPTPPPGTPPVADAPGDIARITLRLPEPLKDGVERAAAAEGISVNAWLVRAIAGALHAPPVPPSGWGGRGSSRRISGFAQA